MTSIPLTTSSNVRAGSTPVKNFRCYPIDANPFTTKMEMYGLKVQKNLPFEDQYDYVKAFNKIPKIAGNHLGSLVRSVAYWYDGRNVRRNFNSRNSNYQTFECAICNFALRFQRCEPYANKDTNDESVILSYYRFVEEKSNAIHICDRQDVVEIPNHKKKETLMECPALYKIIKDTETVNYKDQPQFKKVILELERLYPFTFQTVSESCFSKAKTALKKMYYSKHAQSYCFILILFDELSRLNPTITLMLQATNTFKFYRMFVAVPNAKEIYNKIAIKVAYVDGCYVKYRLYDGVIIVFCIRTGNGLLIIILLSWVPSEDCNHMLWWIDCMKDAGFDVENMLFICDRGNLTSAVLAYYRLYGKVICLFYCLEHIIRNCVSRMKIKKVSEDYRKLRKILGKCQGIKNWSDFLLWILQLEIEFGESGRYLAIYLLEGIHPQHWTFFC